MSFDDEAHAGEIHQAWSKRGFKMYWLINFKNMLVESCLIGMKLPKEEAMNSAAMFVDLAFLGTEREFVRALDDVPGSAPATLSGVCFEMGNFKSVSFFVSFLVMRYIIHCKLRVAFAELGQRARSLLLTGSMTSPELHAPCWR